MANFGNFLRDMAQKVPGNSFAQTRLGDVLTGGVARAINRDEWKIPSLHGDQTSIDDLAAVGTGNSKGYRELARGVGLGFGMWGANTLGGTGTSQGMSGIRNMFRGGNQAPGSDSGPGMTGVRGQAPTNIFEAAPGLMANPDLYNSNAETLAAQGRHGDSNLLHVSDDELNQLKATGKITQNPNTGLPEAFSFGDFAGPIGNIIGGNQNKQDLSGIADKASNASNPLAAPQRQQYQGQLSNMMSPGGAQDFMQNDPSVQAQKRMIGDQMSSTFAKSGNMPLTGIMGSAQLANAFGGQYNQRIQDLTTLGGYNQGNPYGGMPYTATMQPATNRNAGIFGSLGPLVNQMGGMFGGGGGGSSMDIGSLFNNPQYMGGGGMGFD